MQYEFLKQFPRRMKNIGRYATLFTNSSQKTTWRQYGFATVDEQFNMIFAVMLYLMEQSLREESCTMDDIGAYIDTVNSAYFRKEMSYEDCRKMGDFIVNVILSNEGKPMYFEGFDFEARAYRRMNISYVANRIIYLDAEVKRTSYYLTDDGYSLLLGTLEIENNMKLTVHEMIFKMHLEKQSYDKAVDEIKNVFNLLRIQLQKIQEAMGKIRRNALSYSVADYKMILEENMDTIRETRQKFMEYREMVKTRVKELEEENINVRRLDKKEEEKLGHLRVIEHYLNRSIDEHQKILNSHFDLKTLYTRELEDLSKMSLIKRFSLRNDLYDKLLAQPEGLARLDYFFRPLFAQEPEKIYNLNKALELQRPIRRKADEDISETIDFDEESWQKEREAQRLKKLKKYEKSLGILLETLMRRPELTLAQLKEEAFRTEEEKERLVPNVEIFKEIMVELLRSREIDIPALEKERSEYIQEPSGGFQLNEMLLQLLEGYENAGAKKVRGIRIYRIEDDVTVVFEHVPDEAGNYRNIRCSNVSFGMTFADGAAAGRNVPDELESDQ